MHQFGPVLIFLNTAALFAGCLAVHVIVWKVRLPKQQMKALFIIFLAGFLSWAAFSLAHRAALFAIAYVALYFWSLSFFYIITYSAVEADSPTLSLVHFIGTAGDAGRSPDEINLFMIQRPFLGARLAALARSGLIREEEGRYIISGNESFAFRLILGFRKVYGSIPKGG
jgi:hypothetical protein